MTPDISNVFLQKCPLLREKYHRYVGFFEMAPYCYRFLQNLFETFKTVQECFRIDPFIGELPNENLACQNYARALPGLYQGLFIGFHKCFFNIAGDRDCRIDKVEERVAIKLT